MTCVCNQQGKPSFCIWTVRPWFSPWCISMNVTTRRADNSVGLLTPTPWTSLTSRQECEHSYLRGQDGTAAATLSSCKTCHRSPRRTQPVCQNSCRFNYAGRWTSSRKSIRNGIRYYWRVWNHLLYWCFSSSQRKKKTPNTKKKLIICSAVRLKRFNSVPREATRDLPSTSIVQF